MCARDSSDNGDRPDLTAPTIGFEGSFRLKKEDVERYQKAQQARRGSLTVIAGTSADMGNTLVFQQRAVIGREQADIQLHDARISRSHAIVERWGADYAVKDNDSTNGTTVNGQPLQGLVQLADGDRIGLGETEIKFALVDDTEASYLRSMDRLVGTDDLTGLMAKHRFDAALEQVLRSSRHSGTSLSVMMMDMDRLKQVNDAHGHHMGASTIGQVGELIAQIIGGQGKACRFGGDEFSAFLTGFGVVPARAVAEQIRHAVEARDFGPQGVEVRVSISIGVAEVPAGPMELRQALDLADRALYRAKAGGRNRVSE